MSYHGTRAPDRPGAGARVLYREGRVRGAGASGSVPLGAGKLYSLFNDFSSRCGRTGAAHWPGPPACASRRRQRAALAVGARCLVVPCQITINNICDMQPLALTFI